MPWTPCRPGGAAVSTGVLPLPGTFCAASTTACWLAAAVDVGDIDSLEVSVIAAELGSDADTAWHLEAVSVYKDPPGNRLETFFCQRCARATLQLAHGPHAFAAGSVTF